jgi:hypothetical protein
MLLTHTGPPGVGSMTSRRESTCLMVVNPEFSFCLCPTSCGPPGGHFPYWTSQANIRMGLAGIFPRKTTLRYHLTSTIMAKLKHIDSIKC